MDIFIEAWSHLGRGILNTDEFIAMVKKYGKDTGQLAIRWSLQKGLLPLSRSSNLERVGSNIQVFDFEIDAEDMKKIDSLNSNTGYQDIWSYKRQQMY